MANNNQFVLEEEINELTYNFQSKGVGPKGVIPEPSTKQLTAFSKAARSLMAPALAKMAEVEGKTDLERIKMLTAQTEDDDEDTQAQHTAMIEAIAALCSDSPSAEEIATLPMRGQRAFVGWIAGVFMDPNLPTPATS